MTTSISTSRGPITIRSTHEGDAEAFRDLRLQALAAHPEVYGADFEQTSQRTLDQWREQVRLGGDEGAVLIAEANGALVGITTVRRAGESSKVRHVANVFSVYVAPAWRGLRLADALMEAAETWARAHEILQLKLCVLATNASALNCYLRCGFQVYGVDSEAIYWNSRYYDELLMAKRLR